LLAAALPSACRVSDRAAGTLKICNTPSQAAEPSILLCQRHVTN
jgi:hypothetical protein